ncbi:hypothetical protein BE17_24670 [Sorangium cellulosum]|uniref:Uncharacterized protein n=1 Tax=Sorangium cellulosum TaxID=56 RepID=A0A150S8I5_SORCE|nr:hypothetical protein BE17_24670 [Sorangium cellulosum]
MNQPSSSAVFLALLLAAAGCGSSTEPVATERPAPAQEALRGSRYCEILLGDADLGAGSVTIDVYNTQGLNDCPEAAWGAVDEAEVKAETRADVVVLNGPRRWMIDSFEGSKLLDPAVRTLGGIEMRKAGTLTLALAEARGEAKPYETRTVRRDTTWGYDAGNPVYELVDPEGVVHDMQSYSVQEVQQDEASLAKLGEILTLPAGWTFRTRVLDEELVVKAVDGLAVVVQDEFGNTYQRSQQ